MELLLSENIKRIDDSAQSVMGVSLYELMRRAGSAVRDAVVSELPSGGRVLVLCGKGNNGGDGYAMAAELKEEYSVTVLDVFSAGQRSEEGRIFLDKYRSLGGRIVLMSTVGLGTLHSLISEADLIVDAIFGTGFTGELPEEMQQLCRLVNESSATVVAVDIPLGVCSDSAETSGTRLSADITVALTALKPCHVCYPAKEAVGKVVLSDLGIGDMIPDDMKHSDIFMTDMREARSMLPKRRCNGHKGSFGRVAHLTGSDEYRGAAHLALEATLRSGAGMVWHLGGADINSELRLKFPEAIYKDIDVSTVDPRELADFLDGFDSVLIGPGCGASEELCAIITELLSRDGAPLVLDADAINSIARYGKVDILGHSKRSVILTPHPLELSRLTASPVVEIESSRLKTAITAASRLGAVLLLKGAGTVITDGKRAYINTTGSTALSKGGSGDALAGVIASLAAAIPDPLQAAALGAYIHGAAGDTLAESLSEFGVIPSDLPVEIAKAIKKLTSQND